MKRTKNVLIIQKVERAVEKFVALQQNHVSQQDSKTIPPFHQTANKTKNPYNTRENYNTPPVHGMRRKTHQAEASRLLISSLLAPQRVIHLLLNTAANNAFARIKSRAPYVIRYTANGRYYFFVRG